jgi:hypothetical protein
MEAAHSARERIFVYREYQLLHETQGENVQPYA